jgi:hypothetical protein
MHRFRRILSALLVVASVTGIVMVERHRPSANVGASAGLSTLEGFPQVAAGGRISTSWFCPGVAAGDGVSAASVVIANPSDSDITANISYLSDGSIAPKTVTVPARSQETADVLLGRTVGVVAPVVEIIGSVGSVEQQLTYAAGDVTSQCVTDTSSTWYFADGFTTDGSTERIVLVNPFTQSAVVNVGFTTKDGRRTPNELQGLILAPMSSRSVSMSDVGATNESSIAVDVVATSGRVVASRIQHYLGGGRLGYSTTVGEPSGEPQWWFAAGRTGGTVNEQLAVFNPGTDDAAINVSFFGEGITNTQPSEQAIAPTPSAAVTVPAGQVVYVNTDDIADLPKGDHAMVVSSLNGEHLVVEHVLSQRTGGSSFTAITNGVPGPLASTQWRIPSGILAGALNALSILNTTNNPGTFTVASMGPGGLLPLPGLENVALGAASLSSLNVPAGANPGEVVITATVPVIVQRRNARGHGLVGFSIVGALPVRGVQ